MMSEKHTELMTDEEILKGLKREAMMTAAPERFRLYGDAYARLKALTKERNELKKIIDGPDEETIIASSLDKDKPSFALTPQAMLETMDKWAEQDSYPQTYTFTMTEGVWNAFRIVFTQRDQALADVERLRGESIDNQERIKEQVSHTLFMLSTMSGMPIAPEKLSGSYNFTLEELADDLMSVGVAIQLGYDQDFVSTKDGADLDALRSQLTAALARAEAAEKWVGKLEALVSQCRDHLDGCSHGYSDELWDAVHDAVARAAAEQALKGGE